MILIGWFELEFPSLNGIKTPTLPAIKQKNSFIYELTESVELDVFECWTVYLTVNAETNRSEESIEFLKVIIIVLYRYIYELFDIHDVDNMLDDIDLMKFDNYVGNSIIGIDWDNGEICRQWSKIHC